MDVKYYKKRTSWHLVTGIMKSKASSFPSKDVQCIAFALYQVKDNGFVLLRL